MLTILSIILSIQLSLGSSESQLYEIPDTTIENYIDQDYYLTFGTELFIYEYFYIKGSAKILLQLNNEEMEAWPLALSSYFELGAILNNMKVGWKHFCTHPVIPWYNEAFIKFYDEAGNEFFIQFETDKIKIF